MIALMEDQLISWSPWMPASFCQAQEASSVVNSCKLKYRRKKSELPSSEMIWVEISGLPVPPVLPVSAKAAYNLAAASVYPNGVLYTSDAVIASVGTRLSFLVQDASSRMTRQGPAILNIFGFIYSVLKKLEIQVQSQVISTGLGIQVVVDARVAGVAVGCDLRVEACIFRDHEHILHAGVQPEIGPGVGDLAYVVPDIDIIHPEERSILNIIIAQQLLCIPALKAGGQVVRGGIVQRGATQDLGEVARLAIEIVVVIIAQAGAQHKSGAPFLNSHIGAESEEHIRIG